MRIIRPARTSPGCRSARTEGGTGVFEHLIERGYEVRFLSHAEAIMRVDFPSAAQEVEAALAELAIPIAEIIAGGGGESKATQRLRKSLARRGWVKTNFVVEKIINGVPRESQSHEVDHVRSYDDGVRIALEIEWNNKDPFYDRDLENFKRLHADGAISVGMIITRGAALHRAMHGFVTRFLDQHAIDDFAALEAFDYVPTPKQRREISARVQRDKAPVSFRQAFADKFVADKFGEATTHWRKLVDRVQRGVGNPCPLVLIGLPASIVTFD